MNTLTTKNKRNSSFELLRIISMFGIVISHFATHTDFSKYLHSISFNRTVLSMSYLGNISVIVFLLISGYFMINSRFKTEKLIKLILEVMFYSITIYLLLLITGNTCFSIKNFIKSVFPTSFTQYWFFTAYIILYAFSPFINKFYNSITQKTFCFFLLLMLTLWSIVPTASTVLFYSNELLQLFMFYSIGAYLRKHPPEIFKTASKKPAIIGILLGFFIILLISIVNQMVEENSNLISSYLQHFNSRCSIIIIFIAVCLFTLFKNINIKQNKYINSIAELVFGIYLIHDNLYLRPVLWNKIFSGNKYFNSPFLILYMIVTVAIVFLVCLIIEWIRKNYIENYFFKLLYKNKKIKSFLSISYKCD